MMNDKKFRWAYIGCGSIASQTANQIIKGNHTITAVYGRSYDKACSFAEKYGARAYKSLDEMFDEDNFDGVYIATPHNSHVYYTEESINHGKPVLCEKPAGVSAKEFEKVMTLAREKNVYLSEAMWTWFNDVAIKVREWVKEGKIGSPQRVEITHAFPGVMMSKTSRLLTPETAGGALLDVGIYPITYCYNLFGYPKEIKCDGDVENGIDVAERVTLVYEGFECVCNMSLRYLNEGSVIKGSDGSIRLSKIYHVAGRASLNLKSGKDSIRKKTDYLTEFTRVADEIKEGLKESRYVPLDATLDVLKIMDECRAQMNLVYPFER